VRSRLLRDHWLSKLARFPASYSEADVRALLTAFFSGCFRK